MTVIKRSIEIFLLDFVFEIFRYQSLNWFEIIGNFSKAVYFRRPKSFLSGIIDTRDSLVKMTVNNKDVNIDLQKMSHRKKKNGHKLNRFFDQKLDTPLYLLD